MSESNSFSVSTIDALRQAGKLAEARALCESRIAAHPFDATALLALAELEMVTGQPPRAIHYLRRCVLADPRAAVSHASLAHALASVGQYAEAATYFAEAARLDPSAEHLNNLGSLLMMSGHPGDAVAPLRRAIALSPDNAGALFNLGMALGAIDDHASAVEPLRQVTQLWPDNPASWQQLGRSLRATNQWQPSYDAFERSLSFGPATYDIYVHLGECLLELDRPADAIAPIRKALDLRPDFPPALSDLGAALTRIGRLDEAVPYLERAVRFEPDHAESHFNLGLALLQTGDYARGLAEHEWRLKLDHPQIARYHFDQPKWTGQPIAGKTIFLYCESGFGDTLHFIRYAPLLRDRGARVIASTPSELKRLLTGMNFGQVVTGGDTVPPIDFYCPLMSLAHAFGTTLETIPQTIPYITASPADRDAWKRRLERDGQGLRVGVVWAGRPEHRLDRFRSLPADALKPLLDVPNVLFYSLQKGERSRDASALGLIDHTSDLRDFADTAAFVDNLDLVITPDTAIAHLAGAMGKPVWILLCVTGEWRWLRNRTDSPWYPTAKLIYQRQLGDWTDVIARVREELPKFVGR